MKNNNLSEEYKETDDRLVFKTDNDVTVCDSEGKEIEKINKETVKDLKNKIKEVNKINTAETEPPKMVDGEGKKVKYLESKLHLEEPSDVLNEEKIDEAPIPGDLAKGYRGSRYKGGDGYHGDNRVDLQKATYQKLTPEEATDIMKKDPSRFKDFRLLMDGKLVKLRDTGYGESEYQFRNEWLPKEKSYTRRNGSLLRDTSGIHYKNLFKLADAVYITNEGDPESFKDANLMSSRSENPESPNFKRGDYKGMFAPDNRGDYFGWSSDSITGLNKEKNRLKANLAKYEKSALEGGDDADYFKKCAEQTKRTIGDINDKLARMRNSASEMSIRGPINDYKELKNKLEDTTDQIKDLDDQYDKLKNHGSSATARAKSQLAYYNDRLEEILKEISRYEIELDDAPKKDAAELDRLDNLKKDVLKQQKDLEDKKKALFSRSKKESLLYQQIEKNNLVEEFNDLLDTMYPNGYNDENICEALETQQELITESLELEVNNED